MSKPITAVFFDFAGTLFSDRALRDVHLKQLRFVAEAAGVEATDERLRAAYRQGLGVTYRAISGRPSYLHRDLFGGAYREMAAVLGREIGPETVRTAVDRQYRATIDAAALRPDVRATLTWLREAGVHVQIVSNIDEEQLTGLIENLGLQTLVDAATSSEAAGSCKPDPGIYRVALAKAGRRPEEVLFVGDSLSHDVAGPAALGMRTAWLAEDPGDAAERADFVIGALAEVPAIVGGSR